MKLSERASESRLAALIRAGNDEDSFRALQMEFVGYDGGAFVDEPACQRQIEDIASAHLLGLSADVRIAERQPGCFESLRILDTREIELNLPIERCDRAVQVAGMTAAVSTSS